MPNYDYICKACGHALELFQSMSEAPKRKCPACGKLKLERQIGMGAGVLFKGSGFYQTDYRSDSYSKGAKAESESGGKTKESSDSKAKSSEGSGDSSASTDSKSAESSKESAGSKESGGSKSVQGAAEKSKPKKGSDEKR